MKWTRLVQAELRANRRFSWFFIISLAVGLYGFISIDGLRRSFSELLEEASQNMLTADVSLSSRRPLQDKELQLAQETLPPQTTHQDMRSLFSMASKGSSTALIDIEAVPENYPFYGWIELQNRGRIYGKDPKQLDAKNEIWVSPDILLRLQAKIGDSIQIGESTFTITDVIQDSSSASLGSASVAPRAIIGASQLEATGLIQKGSMVWNERLYKLPLHSDALAFKTKLDGLFNDPALRIESHRDTATDNGRVLQYLTDYLGLVALVAFFLAAIGGSYLFRSYLLAKQKDIAILLSLGMTHRQAIQLYVIQIAILGLLAAIVASVVASATLPFAEMAVRQLTPLPFTPRITVKTLALATALGVLGSLLICLPLFMKIRELKPATLFQEYVQPRLVVLRRGLVFYLPALLCFYGLAVWQANSWRVGSLFFACLLGASFVFYGFGWMCLSALQNLSPKKPFGWKIASRYLTRHKVQALSCFLAMSLGSLLVNLVPQLRDSIRTELATPNALELPSFFMFDIQEEQKEDLETLLQQKHVDFQQLSPMIRARLTELNGKPFEKDVRETTTREEEQEQRMRNRGVNLSYRSTLSASEEIIAGRPFSGTYSMDQNDPAEISMEKRYAERLGLELGDVVTYEVQSVPITGKIVNLRKVKWNSFQPNFFILFQPGVLEDAPKTFIASLPTLNDAKKYPLQSEIVQQFPNISMIDVSVLIKKVLEMLDQMSFILTLMAWFSLGAGAVVLYFIANHQAMARLWDSNLMKILGASRRQIESSVLAEFAALGLLAATLGSLLGLLGSYILSLALFNGTFTLRWQTPLLMTLIILVLCVGAAYLANRRVLKRKPRFYL